MSKPSDLVQGTLDLLLVENSRVSDDSLYLALHKLEQEGGITAEWKLSRNNRCAKFYSLTRLGGRELEREAGNRNRLSAADLACRQAERGLTGLPTLSSDVLSARSRPCASNIFSTPFP